MSQVRPKGEKVGEIAAKAVVQLLFATGKSFTVDGLREKLQEFFRQEVRSELRRGGADFLSASFRSIATGSPFSLLEIKRTNEVDVLPRIGRNIFHDLGGRVVSGGLLLCVHASPPDASRGFGVESRRFHAEGDQTFTVLERWAFLLSPVHLFNSPVITAEISLITIQICIVPRSSLQ